MTILKSNVRITVDITYGGSTRQLAGDPPTGFVIKTGGDVKADSTKFRPGGMSPAISLGGPSATDNVIVQGDWADRRRSWTGWINSAVGRGDVTVAQHPLDADANPLGPPLVYRGKLIRFAVPDADSASNDVALFELEVEVTGIPSF